MGFELSRRKMLAAISAGLAAPRAFAAAQAGPACMTMIYMNSRDHKFNSERFRKEHLPLLQRAFGDSVERIELRVAPRPARDSPMPPSPVAVDISTWIRDLAAFAGAIQRSSEEVNADMARVTSAQPVLQFEQVIGEWGRPRESVGMGVEGQAFYYPYSEGAKWDEDYYLGTYLPRLVDAYGGESVLRRVEVRRGVGTQGGGKPALINSVHLYASSNARFGTAGFQAGPKLMKDAAPITTIFPYVASMRVQAVG